MSRNNAALRLVEPAAPPNRIRTQRISKRALKRLMTDIAGLEIALMELDPGIKYFTCSLVKPIHEDDAGAANPIRFTFTAYHSWKGKPPGEGHLVIIDPNDALRRMRERG